MEHEDIIHRLQIIRDQIRYGKTFDADVKLDSLQRILAEEKLTSDNSDYAKCLQRFCDLLDDDDCFDWHGDISGFIEKYKKHFAYSRNVR